MGERVVVSAAKSVAGKELPPIPSNLAEDAVTIVLMYQYIEPRWSDKKHSKVLASCISLAAKHGVTGRGRCAPEGLNCTLTSSAQGARDYCMALRELDPAMLNCDFKLTDGLKAHEKFKAFSLRKTEELVNYDLEGDAAPSIERHGGIHLEAHEYHEAMKKPNSVIIDVRNGYESAIGHFNPPQGGAELIDPKMRNSSDFKKWLNTGETKEKLKGKEVLMYCTGGIRCERATALLNQMKDAEGFETGNVLMVRGGIERYLKTYPDGGYWKGKNYLFDRRMEQIPEGKTIAEVEAEIDSVCCVCLKKHGAYRGQHKCAMGGCKVPVIVCPQCVKQAKTAPEKLRCPLCTAGYVAPTRAPDLMGMKRKLGMVGGDYGDGSVDHDGNGEGDSKADKKRRANKAADKEKAAAAPRDGVASKRLHLTKIPLVVNATAVREALGEGVNTVHWLGDRETGAFYGAAFVGFDTEAQCKAALTKANTAGVKLSKKKVKVALSRPLGDGEVWPPAGFEEKEYPPM
jgi:predicted sulfurtransferase